MRDHSRCYRFSVGACAERFTGPARLRPPGRKRDRTHMRSDVDYIRQLHALPFIPNYQRTRPGASIFQNSGVDLALDSVAVSSRMHF